MQVRDALNHLVPGVIFGGAGVALTRYVASSFLQWKRTGSMRTSVRVSWSPLAEWGLLAWLLNSSSGERGEPEKTRELRRARAVFSFLAVCAVLAALLLITGYHYLRFGRGFETEF